MTPETSRSPEAPPPSAAAAAPTPAEVMEACLAKRRDLLDNLGRFQERVREMYRKEITCGSGCFFCCRTRLSVFVIEAEAIRRHVRAMDEATRARLRERLENDWGPLSEYCAFLDGGSCAIYDERPTLCRIHGLPNSSTTYPSGAVEFCELNFKDFDVDAIAPEAVLDWDHVGHLLALLNFKYMQAAGREREGRLRVPLVELAREGVGLPVETPDAPAAPAAPAVPAVP